VFEIAKGSSTLATVVSFNGTNGANPYAGVTFDTSGNLWGTTYGGGANGYGEVFEIAKGTSVIATVASFNNTNGANPSAGVTFDTSGNLWGTTYFGGANLNGTVFEIVKGSSTITTVANFNKSTGLSPDAAVTFDTSGNLWGTTIGGGANSDGTVFEIINGSNNITSVASFNGANGETPEAAITFDASGNLWGTTAGGGAYNLQSGGYGTVFEIANGSSAITTVASFNYTNGYEPVAPVTFDASGNLWGTTFSGYNGVFEIVNGSSTITPVGAFHFTNGASPDAAVTFDSNGNLWGTTSFGGASYSSGILGDGTVFEITQGSSTVTTIASFIETSGQSPKSGLTSDASGNLWGTTYQGGFNTLGSVFEIVKGSGTITTIASFNGTNGEYPESGVSFDANGDLWGTTYRGGTGFLAGTLSGYGTVFEIANGSSAITTIAFNGTNGANPEAGVTFDAYGNLWGTTYSGASQSSQYGTVFKIANGSNAITTVAGFNSTSELRSEAGVTFDSSGNLWGTALAGGPNNYGAVFEIVKGSIAVTTVANFNGSNGLAPEAGVTFDASGNLWGTTYGGGAHSGGTVYEITKGSSTITDATSFSGSNGYEPAAAVTFDASGNLWGTTTGGGTSNDGTVFEITKGTSANTVQRITLIDSINGLVG
jgi:uncharacterized repeat protein (TIGR03803 family)